MEQEAPPAKKAKPSHPQDDASEEILARLPLRDDAVTTALSSRWPRVFSTLPRLRLGPTTFNSRASLDIGYCDDDDRWVDALDRVLDGRLSPVAAFEVDADMDLLEGYDDWFYSFFRTLCRSGGLQELAVRNKHVHECYVVPSPVYACATLTSLELDACHLRVPGKLTGLRAVRSLVLLRVVATDVGLRRVVSRCRAVERLVLDDCHRVRNVVIRGSSLKQLEIHSYRPLCVALKKAPHLESAKLSLGYGVAEVSWSIYNNSDSEIESKRGSLQLYEFEAQERREQRKTDEATNMVTFLSGLNCAKELYLYLPYEYAKILRNSADWLRSGFKEYQHLITNEVAQKMLLAWAAEAYPLSEHNDGAIAQVVSCLQNSSPNLKVLEIKNDFFDDRRASTDVPDFWEKNMGAAECVQNHLSTVTFYLNSECFQGRSYIDLSKLLLMRARAVERLSIKYRRLEDQDRYSAELESVQSELPLWPRASPGALVEIRAVDRLPSWY
ncbi:hypothetical protein [Oryza sativa Japonica Group]|uniref:F-box/LRR-repeat protein 15/At3g58940/PEG3-like LRR domain-containing protein n=1 Tax=Oryza sativa subsp. japonica TaxID=39947 RepID=Q5JLU0_ORYSJ|nr:hypothetical protein [Oryza sativa Japonica Group]